MHDFGTSDKSPTTAVSGFQSKINSLSGGKANNKRFKLFSSCFRRTAGSTESLEDAANNNVKRRCDYVVEKLVVKHVLFSISENTSEKKISLRSKNNSHRNSVPQSQTKLNTTDSATSKLESLLRHSDRFDSDTTAVPLHVSNKRLHFDKNTSNSERNKNDTSSNDYRDKMIESTNATNGLPPDSGEHEKASPKDPRLNRKPENKSLAFSEISLKGSNKNNAHQAQETFESQSFVQEASSKKEGNNQF